MPSRRVTRHGAIARRNMCFALSSRRHDRSGVSTPRRWCSRVVGPAPHQVRSRARDRHAARPARHRVVRRLVADRAVRSADHARRAGIQQEASGPRARRVRRDPARPVESGRPPRRRRTTTSAARGRGRLVEETHGARMTTDVTASFQTCPVAGRNPAIGRSSLRPQTAATVGPYRCTTPCPREKADVDRSVVRPIARICRSLGP